VILNASSFAALDPNAGRATYSAAKAAVKNLSASMAAEFAAANIRVLAYVPGMIATEIAAESIEKYGDALLADIPFIYVVSLIDRKTEDSAHSAFRR